MEYEKFKNTRAVLIEVKEITDRAAKQKPRYERINQQSKTRFPLATNVWNGYASDGSMTMTAGGHLRKD